MRKVGLVTCFLNNYGACLQAYALSRVIKELGNECTILKYTEPTGYYRNTFTNWLKNSSAYNFFRSIDPKYKKTYKFDKIRRKNFDRFRKDFLPLSREEYSSYSMLESEMQYDAYVCGSDQIWNPTFYGKCNPAYYLKFVPDGIPKISYAPSIGLSDIPAQYTEDFKNYLKRFDAVSVREANAVELVNKYAECEAKWVLDPTMLLNGEKWSEITTENTFKNPYIFCYLFGKHDHYRSAIENIRKQTGYDVVIIPFSERDLARDYRQVYKAGPIEFISLIKNAEYVLTDSFHATVFSILFGKPFYTLLRNSDGEIESMNSRIYSLLSMVGKEERCVAKTQAADFQVTPITDYQTVYQKLDEMRNESVEFLRAALEEQDHER